MKILALEEKVMNALLEAAYAQFIRMEANGVALTHEEKQASTAAILTLADLRYNAQLKRE